MPGPIGTPKRDSPFLLRMTADQDAYVRGLARDRGVALNTAIGDLIDGEKDRRDQHPEPPADPPGTFRVTLTTAHHAYIQDHAEQWDITPEQAIADMIEHCIQHDRYDRIMAERQKASQAPAAPAPPKNPGGTRKERGARTTAPRRRTGGAFPTGVPAGFRAPAPEHIDGQTSITDPDQ